MTDEKRKLEPPLKLDMPFSDALRRFISAAPKEVDESIKRSKTKKSPEISPRRPARQKRD